MSNEDKDLEKGNYGPRGTAAGAQYQPHANQERKANNVDKITELGPNQNVKQYTTGGRLTAKEEAARMNSKRRVKSLSGPVIKPTLTDEEKARYTANIQKDELGDNKCTTCGFVQLPADRAKDSAGCKGGKPHVWPVVKNEMLEVAPDGKQEIVEGTEPLKKDPKKRWKALKKALNHEKAFMDLEDAMGSGEEQQQQQPQAQPEAVSEGGEQPQGGDDAAALQQELQPEGGGEEQPEQEGQEPSEAVSQEQEGQEEEQPEQPEEGAQEPQLSPEDQQLQEQVQEGEADPQELIDALTEEGYSEQEISYIVHGHHAPEIDPTKQAKAQATSAMSDIDIENAKRQAELEHSHQEQSMAAEREHKKRMFELEAQGISKKHALMDQEVEHKKRLSEVELQQAQQSNPQALEQEHKKRMLDLEYSKAQKEAEGSDGSEGDAEANRQMKLLEVEKKKLELQLRKEEVKMELEFKKREHELKLKMMEAQLKEQMKQKSEIGGIKHEQKLAEAKNPPKEVKDKKKST